MKIIRHRTPGKVIMFADSLKFQADDSGVTGAFQYFSLNGGSLTGQTYIHFRHNQKTNLVTAAGNVMTLLPGEMTLNVPAVATQFGYNQLGNAHQFQIGSFDAKVNIYCRFMFFFGLFRICQRNQFQRRYAGIVSSRRGTTRPAAGNRHCIRHQI